MNKKDTHVGHSTFTQDLPLPKHLNDKPHCYAYKQKKQHALQTQSNQARGTKVMDVSRLEHRHPKHGDRNVVDRGHMSTWGGTRTRRWSFDTADPKSASYTNSPTHATVYREEQRSTLRRICDISSRLTPYSRASTASFPRT